MRWQTHIQEPCAKTQHALLAPSAVEEVIAYGLSGAMGKRDQVAL